MNDPYEIFRRRDAIFRNPTLEAAMEVWPRHLLGDPVEPNTPLAGIHKARILWRSATPAMIAESRAWLAEHGYDEGVTTTEIKQ